jgi:hypothetical protein
MPHPNLFRFEDHPEARVFPPTTPESIAAMSRRQGVRVPTDWAAFLLERNGYDFNTVTAGKPVRAPFNFADTAMYLFGVGTGFEFNDLDDVLSDEAVFQRPYRSLMTPIGMAAAGDLIVQVTAGPQIGNVVLFDHKVHLNFGPDEFERQAKRPLSHPDTGTVVDLMTGFGLLVPLADSLQGFFDLLIVETESDGTVTNVQISYPDRPD